MESGGGGGSMRRQSLSDEYRPDSANLRDFLRVKEDNSNSNNSLAGLTLGAVLTQEKRLSNQVQPNRTLFDIIRDDNTSSGKENKKTWKSFRDKLRLRRTGSAWTSSIPIPASDVPVHQNNFNNSSSSNNHNRMMMRRESSRFPTMNNADENPNPELTQPDSYRGDSARGELSSAPSSRAMLLRRNTSRIPERQGSRLTPIGSSNFAEPEQQQEDVEPVRHVEEDEENTGDDDEAEGEEGEVEEGGDGPVRMSLMALLAETDRQMGLDGSSYMMGEEEEEEEDDDDEEESIGGAGGGGEYNNCCVCMVRHKGAAFIPCGHTFCRLCSRELWVQRGNCPICNNFILEILDIF